MAGGRRNLRQSESIKSAMYEFLPGKTTAKCHTVREYQLRNKTGICVWGMPTIDHCSVLHSKYRKDVKRQSTQKILSRKINHLSPLV